MTFAAIAPRAATVPVESLVELDIFHRFCVPALLEVFIVTLRIGTFKFLHLNL